MAKNINTVAPTMTDTDLIGSALAVFNTLKRAKGDRPAAARAFLEAATDADREEALAEFGSGLVRRGLREAAIFFANKGDAEFAGLFYAVRDSITLDGDVLLEGVA